jgi:hypothetical protein
MTLCFILDPQIPHQPSRCDIFQALASTEFGWRFERKQMFTGQIDGQRWIEDVFAALERADVTVCFGEWLAVAQLGPESERFLKRLGERARNGMPVLLQVYRLGEKAANSAPSIPVGLIRLLRDFEVQPSDIRVGSERLIVETHPHPYVSWFTKGDGCLSNPRLFTGIERVLMSDTNLLDYDGDAFPIIEASSLHYFVNRGDLKTTEIPGRRAACATIRQVANELQIILGGSVLSDPRQVMRGLTPGIDENKPFALRLLQLIEDHVTQRARHDLAAYGIFSKIERTLGKVVKAILEPIAPAGQLWRMFPDDIQINLHNKEGGPPHYSRAGFGDLCRIVTSNWVHFKNVFAPVGFEEFKRCMAALNREQRIYLAHPHKAEEEGMSFTPKDLLLLERAEKMVKGAWRRVG